MGGTQVGRPVGRTLGITHRPNNDLSFGTSEETRLLNFISGLRSGPRDLRCPKPGTDVKGGEVAEEMGTQSSEVVGKTRNFGGLSKDGVPEP